MAKGKKAYKKKEQKEAPKSPQQEAEEEMLKKLPKEVRDDLEKTKKKLEKYKDKILEKFEEYIKGVALLPPEKPKEGEEQKDQKINVLILIDDTESHKMSKQELKDKLTAILDDIAASIDKRILPQPLLLSELWQSCYDAKYEVLKMIALAAPIYDTGLLSAVKLTEIHKEMVLKKFEKYIVTYVLGGSLTQGKATPESDIDVWIVIDDTDVKKITRAELKDKLRSIIISMGIEAGEMTGIQNKLNVQVWILTDYWEALKDSNPVMFTLLRDGVPFYDRGLFTPWKQLLIMGKIKPSKEAIDMFMNTGEQLLERVKYKIKEMGIEDTYYAILNPSQAAIMLYGLPPPTHKEAPHMMREIFVKKEGLLEEKFVKILEHNVKVRKELEHGTKKELSGKEVDELIKGAEDYLKRIERLFKQIEKIKEEKNMVELYDKVITIIRDVLKLEGIEKAQDEEIINLFENELIASGKIPAKILRDLNEIIDAKRDYDKGKLTKAEVEKAKQGSNGLIKFLVEYMQRKRGIELERAKIRVKVGNKFGEVLLLEDNVFIVHDIDAEDAKVSTTKLDKDGSFGIVEDSTLEEFEKSLAKAKFPEKIFIREKTFESLKKVFGKDVEILVNY